MPRKSKDVEVVNIDGSHDVITTDEMGKPTRTRTIPNTINVFVSHLTATRSTVVMCYRKKVLSAAFIDSRHNDYEAIRLTENSEKTYYRAIYARQSDYKECLVIDISGSQDMIDILSRQLFENILQVMQMSIVEFNHDDLYDILPDEITEQEPTKTE